MKNWVSAWIGYPTKARILSTCSFFFVHSVHLFPNHFSEHWQQISSCSLLDGQLHCLDYHHRFTWITQPSAPMNLHSFSIVMLHPCWLWLGLPSATARAHNTCGVIVLKSYQVAALDLYDDSCCITLCSGKDSDVQVCMNGTRLTDDTWYLHHVLVVSAFISYWPCNLLITVSVAVFFFSCWRQFSRAYKQGYATNIITHLFQLFDMRSINTFGQVSMTPLMTFCIDLCHHSCSSSLSYYWCSLLSLKFDLVHWWILYGMYNLSPTTRGILMKKTIAKI